ncbi:MAG: hypothetical protein ACK5V6_03935, partial [Pseudanabaena sp.]
ELDPPKIIINTITDAGSKLGPITPQAKNAIQWRKGMKAMYQGLGWSIAILGTATAKILRNGFELWVNISELAIADDLAEIDMSRF